MTVMVIYLRNGIEKSLENQGTASCIAFDMVVRKM